MTIILIQNNTIIIVIAAVRFEFYQSSFSGAYDCRPQAYEQIKAQYISSCWSMSYVVAIHIRILGPNYSGNTAVSSSVYIPGQVVLALWYFVRCRHPPRRVGDKRHADPGTAYSTSNRNKMSLGSFSLGFIMETVESSLAST